eukprot:SAG31_NODE_325_length_17671_cov_9.902743_17_plen_88_part_00
MTFGPWQIQNVINIHNGVPAKPGRDWGFWGNKAYDYAIGCHWCGPRAPLPPPQRPLHTSVRRLRCPGSLMVPTCGGSTIGCLYKSKR